jgi:hypothetical protein
LIVRPRVTFTIDFDFSSMSFEPNDEDKRYYPSHAEHQILIHSVKQYFSKPERSFDRNRIATDVAAQLASFSSHWTHRTVRLWFNNNRHAYASEIIHPDPTDIPHRPPSTPYPVSPITGLMERAASLDGPAFRAALGAFDATLPVLRPCPFRGDNRWTMRRECVLTFPRPADFGARKAVDQTVAPFEASFVDGDCAAFIHNARMEPTHAVSFAYDATPNERVVWKSKSLGRSVAIESFVVDSDRLTGWFISEGVLNRVHLIERGKVHAVELGPLTAWRSARLAVLGGMVVVASPTTADLKRVDRLMKVETVKTPYECGMTAICPMGQNLICGISKSMAIRMIDVRGTEVGSFLGHADPPTWIVRATKQVFASGSDDGFVKLWDLRQRVPIGHIGIGEKVMAMSATETNVVIALADHQIGVVDIRGATPEPVLGVSTDEYAVSSMHYDEGKDVLRMFGRPTKEGIDKNTTGQCNWRRYIFREYASFLHM